MTDVVDDPAPETAPPTRRLGLIRLAIGLVQGLALFALHRAADGPGWPGPDSLTLPPLLRIAAFVPVLLLSGDGPLRGRPVLVCRSAAAAVLAFLGRYDVSPQSPGHAVLPS